MHDAGTEAARIEVAARTLEGAACKLGGLAGHVRELASVEAEGGSLLAWAELAGRLAGFAETLSGFTDLAGQLVDERYRRATAEVEALPRP